MPEFTVAAAETAARKVLDSRVSAVRTLAETRAAVGRARQALVDAEKADTATWAATLRAGWSTPTSAGSGSNPPPDADSDDPAPAPPSPPAPTRRGSPRRPARAPGDRNPLTR